MSYILEALEKDGKNKPASGEQVEELSSSSGTNSAQPTEAAHGVVHTSNISISWGILLFIAIMSALVLGFWLGQQNNPIQKNNSPEIKRTASLENNSTSVIQKNAEKEMTSQYSGDIEKIEMLEEQGSVVAKAKVQTPNNAASQMKPNPAEQYFENPPQDVTKDQSLNTINKTEIASETQTARTIEQENFKSGNIEPGNIEEFTAEDLKAVDGISDDLLAKFKTALTETASQQDDLIEGDSVEDEFSYNQDSIDPYRSVKPLSDMPERMQDQLPTLQFEQHIFASDGEGWVKVNGRDRYEGDTITTGVLLIKIQPQEVILEFRDRVFSMPALSSW